MSNKAMSAIIGGCFAVFMAIGGWYVSRCESKFDVVDRLQWKDFYLNGEVKAAPVPKPEGTPPPPVAKK
jgi:hypothetical protein